MLAWVGWRLAREWAAATPPALRWSAVDASAAVGCAVTALLLLAGLFALNLRLIGYGGSPAYAVRVWLQGYFWRYVPGKVMLVVERARLGEAAGIPRSTSVALVFWETLLLLAGAGVMASMALPWLADAAGASRPVVLAATGGTVVAAVLLPTALRALTARVPALAGRLDAALLRQTTLQVLGLVGGYAVVWLLLGASFAFTCRCFVGGEAVGLDVALRYVVGYVAGLVLSLTPAGLGVREGLVVAGLGGAFPAPVALAFALASRALMTAVEVALVGLATLVPPPRADA